MMSASYLLRFDDVCPTMNWTVWSEIEQLLLAENIRPILAVVPDNQDPVLRVGDAVPDFWDRVRRWQALGWAIGLHGYQHRYVTANSGLIGRNKYSEFAGLTYQEQSSKLGRAIQIFQSQGVRADLWIAPAHSYDETTLDLLDTLGIHILSDGYELFPYVDRRKILCIPQQLGTFRWAPFGVWTICMHPNGWNDSQLRYFCKQVRGYKPAILSLTDVTRKYRLRPRQASDNLFALAVRAARVVRS